MALAIMAWHALSPSPRAPRRAPCGLRGIDGSARPSKWLSCQRMANSASWSERWRRTGDIGDGLRTERVVERLQGPLLQVEVPQIVVHEADEPNAIVNFLDAKPLTSQRGRDVDLLAMQAKPSTGGDEDIAVMERIGELGQAVIAAR